MVVCRRRRCRVHLQRGRYEVFGESYNGNNDDFNEIQMSSEYIRHVQPYSQRTKQRTLVLGPVVQADAEPAAREGEGMLDFEQKVGLTILSAQTSENKYVHIGLYYLCAKIINSFVDFSFKRPATVVISHHQTLRGILQPSAPHSTSNITFTRTRVRTSYTADAYLTFVRTMPTCRLAATDD